MAAFCFACHLIHDGQRAGPGTDYEVPAVPRNVLFDGERCVAETAAELLGWLLPALADVTVVDDDVMLVGDAVDANGGLRKTPRSAWAPPGQLYSLRSDAIV